MNSTNPVGRRRFQVDYDRPKDEYPNNNPRRDEDDVFGYRHLKPIGSKAYEPNCKQECDHAATEFQIHTITTDEWLTPTLAAHKEGCIQ